MHCVKLARNSTLGFLMLEIADDSGFLALVVPAN